MALRALSPTTCSALNGQVQRVRCRFFPFSMCLHLMTARDVRCHVTWYQRDTAFGWRSTPCRRAPVWRYVSVPPSLSPLSLSGRVLSFYQLVSIVGVDDDSSRESWVNECVGRRKVGTQSAPQCTDQLFVSDESLFHRGHQQLRITRDKWKQTTKHKKKLPLKTLKLFISRCAICKWTKRSAHNVWVKLMSG